MGRGYSLRKIIIHNCALTATALFYVQDNFSPRTLPPRTGVLFLNRFSIALLCLFILSACASPRITNTNHVLYDRNGMPLTDIGPPKPVPPAGTAYSAVASWYGPGFQGHRTASGDIFNEDALTCAHRSYPFGTELEIENPQTGKECVVTVNDRGPFVKGVDIDISRGASRAIGRLDTGPVIVREIGRNASYIRKAMIGNISGKGLYTVQVGAFTDPENAGHLLAGLKLGYDGVRISKAIIRGVLYNRVRVGKFPSLGPAFVLARRLAREGYPAWVVRGY